MKDLFKNYVQAISSKFVHNETSEMGYRTDFEILIKGIFESINVKRIDHDAKAKLGNKPDFVILNKDIPILYIEAKDIGVSLDKVEKSEQMKRYFGYANLVLTDYTEFRFYRNGLPYEEPIKIANFDTKTRNITPIPENYEHVAKSMLDFAKSHKEPIKSGKHLSKIMGGKAQRIRDNVRHFIETESEQNTDLIHVYEAIKKSLVHDLTHESFADMYAQTLTYGLFVARYYDKTLKDFSRKEARDLVPKSNPLLQHFFDHIVGPHFDKRLEYIVDELCVVFSHANVQELMKEYFKDDLWGNTHKGPDPVIHFYEDFLKEYDDTLRKKMGAYYTPLPVVQFIVRSIDHLLEKEFDLSSGLADISKTKDGLHRVQVLDPAVGTGTFFSSVVGKVYERILETKQEGRWPAYVHHDLLPRLHGFEIMMTPYTIAHLKLGMAFEKTGFKYFNQRLGIYLTNALEQSGVQQDLFSFGFAESIAEESKKASIIKNKTPIMVVVGNPPYAGESSNAFYKGHDVYKVEPGGKEKLKEKNSKWINDDYVKFIRFAESMVEKNTDGVIGMITSHGYLDNQTFRGMRWHLRKTFDTLYVIDLHGNANRKEVTPDGGKDENVFSIKTGTAIIFGVKKTAHQDKGGHALATVFQADLWGTRDAKFSFLNEKEIDTVTWNKLPDDCDIWRVESEGKETYKSGISLKDLFLIQGNGIVTKRDKLTIDRDKSDLWKRILFFFNNNEQTVRSELQLPEDVRDWKFEWAHKDIADSGPAQEKIQKIAYRPFDNQYIYYTGQSRGFVGWPVAKVMRHYLTGDNVGILATKGVRDREYNHVFVTNTMSEAIFLSGTTATNAMNFPLYIYDGEVKTSNLSSEIVKMIDDVVGSTKPEDILDYVYSVLHAPSYRKKYTQFLKENYPRVPMPSSKDTFWQLVELGRQLRSLHLLESSKVQKYVTSFPLTGSDLIDQIKFENGNIHINDEQYFGNVPETAWNFYIGGYQPARKWLKDRKGRKLTNEDIEHYQKMIVALFETNKLMKEIDKIIQL